MPRRRGGFRRLSSVGADEIGIPSARARELALAGGWADAAGPVLSARARPEGIRRGVLTVAVSDRRWRDALAEILPMVAGRLSALHPELAIRRVRVVLAGDAVPGPAVDVVLPGPGEIAWAVPGPAPARPAEPPRRAPDQDPLDRLRMLAQRCMELDASRRPRR